MRYVLALFAMAAVGTASPALARKEDKNTGVMAAIQARVAQLRASPQDRKCLGADAATCLASLSLGIPPTAEIGSSLFDLPAPAPRDIYGRSVPATMSFRIRFNATNDDPVDDDDVYAHIDLGDGEHVDTIYFSLNESPLFARTESDWAATRVFELATAVLGPACVGTDRIAFYRRYDAIQRQSSTDYVDRGRDAFRYALLTGKVKICGVTMSVGSSSQYSRSLGYGSSLRFTL